MDRLDAMATFVAVAEAGGFSRASERTGIPVSTLSRTVAALEARLRSPLLVRNTRRISLTENGREYLAHCKRILGDIDEAEAALGREASSVSGKLRITAPAVFGRAFAAPLSAEFVIAHPGIEMELSLTDRMVDLIGEGFDVAIRTAELEDSELIVRRVGHFHRILCCAPEYLQRVGGVTSLADLDRLSCLVFTKLRPLAHWPLVDETGALTTIAVKGNISADNTDALIEGARGGAGVILIPSWQVRADLAAGKLVRILPRYQTPPIPVCILLPRTKLLLARVRAFVDAATAQLPAFLGNGVVPKQQHRRELQVAP